MQGILFLELHLRIFIVSIYTQHDSVGGHAPESRMRANSNSPWLASKDKLFKADPSSLVKSKLMRARHSYLQNLRSILS